MNTPIFDFVTEYAKKDAVRLHMPGHKGKSHLGFEQLDITELYGADSLYLADGIIKESEENASSIFGTGRTLYSCEGSSLCIRAMMYLIKAYSGQGGYVLSTRNAHSSFISACALNDIDIEWIFPKDGESYLSCVINGEIVENCLSRVQKMPDCVYVTSPDYLGNLCDIKSIAAVCRRYGIPLIVDNAHGAYLKFLDEDIHPITLGATMCCDSAHKTLPVLTGGAYLHISKDAPSFFKENAKSAMHLFGSTSPSYLILTSLDKANKYLSHGYKENLRELVATIKEMFSSVEFCALFGAKHTLEPLKIVIESKKIGYRGDKPSPVGEGGPQVANYIDGYALKAVDEVSVNFNLREPLKIVIESKKIGYRGEDFAKILYENNIVCEFYDEDYVVLMPSLENGIRELEILRDALLSVKKKEEIVSSPLPLIPPKKAMSVREATYAKKERISIENALDRVLATSTISCPPAVSLIVSGEEFNQSIIDLCKKYGFTYCDVVKK